MLTTQSSVVISTTLTYIHTCSFLWIFDSSTRPPNIQDVTANNQFYQAFPHVSTASDKSWSKKAWVWGYRLVPQSWFSSAVKPLYLVLAVMPSPAVLALQPHLFYRLYNQYRCIQAPGYRSHTCWYLKCFMDVHLRHSKSNEIMSLSTVTLVPYVPPLATTAGAAGGLYCSPLYMYHHYHGY